MQRLAALVPRLRSHVIRLHDAAIVTLPEIGFSAKLHKERRLLMLMPVNFARH